MIANPRIWEFVSRGGDEADCSCLGAADQDPTNPNVPVKRENVELATQLSPAGHPDAS